MKDEIERKIEKLKAENQYMDHILDKVRDFFHMNKEAALIDIEIFLSRQNKQNG